MASIISTIFFLVVALPASAAAAASASSTSFPPPPILSPSPPPCVPPPPTLAFLHARCAATQYRATCYDSLIPYGCAFQTSHVKLARAAADVNHVRLRVLSKRVKELVPLGGGSTALRDCASTVSSAAGLARQSAAELAKLDNAGAAAVRADVRRAISNAQTWLSAAMTNEGTCVDGLGAAAGGSPASREVVTGIATAKEHTSIALALVNGIPLPP